MNSLQTHPLPETLETQSVIDKKVWYLGRSLLMLWLRHNRKTEAWFLASPIHPAKLLAKWLQSHLRSRAVAAEARIAHARALRSADLVVRRSYLTEKEALDEGMSLLAKSAPRLAGDHSYFARYLHLRGFMLRVSGQTAHYLEHMAEFQRHVEAIRNEAPSAETINAYESRLTYEQGSWALYGMRGKGVRSAQRMTASILAFRESEEVALAERSTELQHVLYGSLRNQAKGYLMLGQPSDAIAKLEQLERLFPHTATDVMPYDIEFTTCASRYKGAHPRLAEVLNRLCGEPEGTGSEAPAHPGFLFSSPATNDLNSYNVGASDSAQLAV